MQVLSEAVVGKLWRHIVWGMGVMIAVTMLGVAVVCTINPHRHQLYLIDIFSVPLFSGFMVITALLVWWRQRWAGGLAGLACALMLAAVWPQAFPNQPAADTNATPVRVVFANLLIRNMEPEKLLPWVEAQEADIVALVEANPRARKRLMDGLKVRHPHIVTRYDMVIASRYPVRMGPARGSVLLVARVDAPRPFTLAVTHLTRPWPYTKPRDQPRQFRRLADDLASDLPDNLVLVGDFNTTPSASGLGDFRRETGLHGAPSLGGTWPSLLPSLLRLSIDNVLASPDLVLKRRKVGPFSGSDHRPVCVDIYPAKGA